MKNKSKWQSSYEENNYGELFYSLTRIYTPKTVIELGTKAGYSAYHMARGLSDNKKGRLECYDLWEKYEFNSVSKEVAINNLRKFSKIVKLNQRNVIGVDKIYKKVDFLHVDLGNHGEILEKIIPKWIDKVNQLIIIEGGSEARDKYPWMQKYNKIPIKSWIEKFVSERKDIEYFTITPFPSITIIRKKL